MIKPRTTLVVPSLKTCEVGISRDIPVEVTWTCYSSDIDQQELLCFNADVPAESVNFRKYPQQLQFLWSQSIAFSIGTNEGNAHVAELLVKCTV